MKNWLIGIGIGVVAIALGIGAAYGAGTWVKSTLPAAAIGSRNNDPECQPLAQIRDRMQTMRQGRMGSGNRGRGFRNGTDDSLANGVVTLDSATKTAEAYAASVGSNLQLAETVEFSRAYYFVFTEKDGGRGAIEVVVEKKTGDVQDFVGRMFSENLKYPGKCAFSAPRAYGKADNTVSLADARTAAQNYLKAQLPNATLSDGYSFYGFYTFFYSVDGKPAGLLHVNGFDSSVHAFLKYGPILSKNEAKQ